MKIIPTEIDGVYVVELEPHHDDRGHFARAWCHAEFAAVGISADFVQMNLASSHRAGTLRGLHFQQEPFWEQKLVRCIQGRAFVVAVDVRPNSPTHRKWVGVELRDDHRHALFVGRGCAQGYQTLEDQTTLLYLMSEFYHPESSAGWSHCDPAFAITWPLPVSAISPQDLRWSSYQN